MLIYTLINTPIPDDSLYLLIFPLELSNLSHHGSTLLRLKTQITPLFFNIGSNLCKSHPSSPFCIIKSICCQFQLIVSGLVTIIPPFSTFVDTMFSQTRRFPPSPLHVSNIR